MSITLLGVSLAFTPRLTQCVQSPLVLFLHTVWSCHVLTPFWESVTQILSQLYDIPLRPDPLFLLLGHLELNRYTKTFLSYAHFYARQEILL